MLSNLKTKDYYYEVDELHSSIEWSMKLKFQKTGETDKKEIDTLKTEKFSQWENADDQINHFVTLFLYSKQVSKNVNGSTM